MMNEVQTRDDAPRTARLVVGALLVGLGLVLFLERADLMNLHGIHHWWPFIVTAVGVAQLVSGGPRRKARSGVLLILLSLWFLVATHGWYGLDWGESWPLALIAVGASQILVPSRRQGTFSGLFLVALGLIFLAAFQGFLGITLEGALPVALVLAGGLIVWRAIRPRTAIGDGRHE